MLLLLGAHVHHLVLELGDYRPLLLIPSIGLPSSQKANMKLVVQCLEKMLKPTKK